MSSIISVLTRFPNLYIELTKVLPNVKFHEVTSPGTDPQFKQSNIIISDYDLLGPFIYDLPNAKWVQATWAGIDYLLPHIRNNNLPLTITRFSGQHFGRIMGEYVLANIVMYERNFFQVKDNQRNQLWVREGKVCDYRPIFDLTIGVLGLGSIGNRIVKMLDFMGAKVMGYGRESKPEFNYLTGFYTKATLPSLLKSCDYIINVLPSTTETNNLLGNDILKNCEGRNCVLINIGRGNIISEEDLIKALNNNWLSGAVLDVFNAEPLKKDSELWTMPQVFITPHVAGNSRAKDIAQQFSDNFKLYQKNLPLPAIINLAKGY